MLEGREKPRKPLVRWPVTGPYGCILTALRKTCPSVPFPQKLHVDWPGIEHKNLSERPATNLLSHGTPLQTEMKLNYIQR
jgi:hypothetical protein